MNKIIKSIISLTMAFSLVGSSTSFAVSPEHNGGEVEIYVSPKGSDSGDGSIENPFKTIDRARQELQTINKDENKVTIYLREGEYNYANKTLRFTEADSGTDKNPVTVKAYNNEAVEIKGSVKLKNSDFKKIDDNDVLEGLDKGLRDNIYQISLSQYGIRDYGDFTRIVGSHLALVPDDKTTQNLMLYSDGMSQTIARYPNVGWTQFGKLLSAGSSGSGNHANDTDQVGFEFEYEDERLLRWTKAPNAWLVGYPQYYWSFTTARVDKVDVNKKTILTEHASYYTPTKGKPFYIANLIEELDIPGEYYIDNKKGILYYYPIDRLEKLSVELAVNKNNLVELDGCKNINIEGINIGYTVGSGLALKDAENCHIKNCEIAHIGGAEAVVFDGCMNCGVSESDGYDVSGKFCVFLNCGDRMTLTESNCYFENCDIYEWAMFFRQEPAVHANNSVGIRVKNNTFHNSTGQVFHAADEVTGNNEIKFENNEIYLVSMEATDSGSVYMGKRWDSGGASVSNNFFHNMFSENGDSTTHTMAVYFDDMFSGVKVNGNVFYKVVMPFLFGGGNHNTIKNNFILDSNNSFIYDNRGENWAINCPKYVEWGDIYKYHFNGTWPWDSKPWTEKYPYMSEYFAEHKGEQKPYAVEMVQNMFINSGEKATTLADSVVENGTVDNMFVNNYTEFVNAENYDFTIPENSEIYEKFPDFELTDVNSTGVQTKPVPKHDITLLLPLDKEKEVENSSVVFKWHDYGYSGAYLLTVAKDREFEKPVFEDVVYHTYFEMKGVLSDEKTHYYWKVEPIEIGMREKTAGYDYEPQIFEFTTKRLGEREFSELEKQVTRYEKAMEKAVEGSELGNYAVGSKGILKEVGAVAKAVLDNPYSKQRLINAEAEKLKEALKAFENTQNLEYTNIDEMLDTSKWYDPDHAKIIDGYLETTVDENSASSCNTYTQRKIGRHEVLKFRFKGSIFSWQALSLRMPVMNPANSWDYPEAVGVYIKRDIFELQSGRGDLEGNMQIYENNEKIPDNQWCDIEYGVVDTFDGFRTIFRVNGNLIIDYSSVCDEDKVPLEGYFTMTNANSNISKYTMSIGKSVH